MEKTTYVMRHGEDAFKLIAYEDYLMSCTYDCVLTEKGKAKTKQSVKLLNKELEGIKEVVVYTGPERRAVQTSKILEKGLEGKVVRIHKYKVVHDGDLGEVASDVEKISSVHELVEKITRPYSILVTDLSVTNDLFPNEKCFDYSEYRRLK